MRNNFDGLGLTANGKRTLKSGTEYDAYFPPARNDSRLIKRVSDVNEIVDEIQRIVRQTRYQTEKIAPLLKRKTTYDTCRAIFDFVYEHINYATEKDEQLREPARTWFDRNEGVDCDCYTIFISSILTNLGIDHYYRLAEYKNKGYFQHIYIVVKKHNQEIIIDCVKDSFNKEHPYSNIMDLPVNQLGNIPMQNQNIPHAVRQRLQQMQGMGNTPPPATDKPKEEKSFIQKYWLAGVIVIAVAGGWFMFKPKPKGRGTSGTGERKAPRNYKKEAEKAKVKVKTVEAEKDQEIADLRRKLREAKKSNNTGLQGTKKK